MSEPNQPNQELEAILKTLAALSQPQNAPLQFPQTTQTPAHSLDASQNEAARVQYQYSATDTFSHAQDPRLPTRHTQTQQSLPAPQAHTSASAIDPATITEWRQGLRCVVKIAAQNPTFAASIRKLMKDQEQNVKAWENGRLRLIDEQKVKRDNEQMHRAALSLPGLLDNTPLLRTPERDQEELSRYDQKVYRASKSLVGSQTSSLKALGVPFFGTKPHLILHDDEEAQALDATDSMAPDHSDGKITEKQLLELQRKMLNHLLELYAE